MAIGLQSFIEALRYSYAGIESLDPLPSVFKVHLYKLWADIGKTKS